MAHLRQRVVTPDQDFWFVAQELEFKVFIKIQVELAEIQELTKMAPLRYGVVNPNCKQTSWDNLVVAQELKFKV